MVWLWRGLLLLRLCRRAVDVPALEDGHVVGQELEGDHGQDGWKDMKDRLLRVYAAAAYEL